MHIQRGRVVDWKDITGYDRAVAEFYGDFYKHWKGIYSLPVLDSMVIEKTFCHDSIQVTFWNDTDWKKPGDEYRIYIPAVSLWAYRDTERALNRAMDDHLTSALGMGWDADGGTAGGVYES